MGGSEHGYYRPSLAEIIEAAELVFPGIPLERLEISAGGYDAEIIFLSERRP